MEKHSESAPESTANDSSQPSAAAAATTTAASASAAPAAVATRAETPLPTSMSPLKIDDRYELLYLLNEAAELEHGAACTYLYAAFSLKSAREEGLTQEQLEDVLRWKRITAHVAVQEMIHLALVNNLLTALGGAPHFDRPNFPQRSLYAPEIQLELTPFNEQTLERFLYIERPDGMDITTLARDFDVRGPRLVTNVDTLIMPARQDFSSIGQLYKAIEEGLTRLVGRLGEAQVFLGSPRAQAQARYIGFPERIPELIPVTDLATAHKAISVIVEEGEGARSDWKTAHFGQFVKMLREYRERKAQDPSFAPTRPVLENPHLRMPRGLEPEDAAHVHLVDDPFTCEVLALFDACYDVALQLLNRFFCHTEEREDELTMLGGLAVEQMMIVIHPLGELLTQLPAGPRYPGMTAGPNFLTSRRTLLTPHKPAAWTILRERLQELAAFCGQLMARPDAPPIAGMLGEPAGGLMSAAMALAPHGGPGGSGAGAPSA